jgi:LysR family transcriptional regulator, regulator for metE and metH
MGKLDALGQRRIFCPVEASPHKCFRTGALYGMFIECSKFIVFIIRMNYSHSSMKLEIRHLQLVIAITEEQSVTRAGERLRLTQSALSHQLRDIEGKLGTPLFLRRNKKMLPTQAGERLLVSARQILGELNQVEEELTRTRESQSGSLRISTECYTCYHWLPKVLKEYHRRFPGVDVQIVLEATHHPVRALLNGKLDLAIISNALRDKRIEIEPLFQDEVVAVLNPEHPLTKRSYLSAGDFVNQHLFLYIPPKESELFRTLFLPAGVKPAKVSVVQLTEAILEMVKAGLGVAVMARWAVQDQIDAGLLVPRRVTRKGLHRQWSAATLRTKITPSYVGKFIELLSSSSSPRSNPLPSDNFRIDY